MYSLTYIAEGLGLLCVVSAFNLYSLNSDFQPYNQYQPFQDYNSPYSLQPNKIPTPLSPRYFVFLNNGTFPFTFPQVESCMSVFAPNMQGSCLKFASCLLKGGKPVGKCGFGFKTCCIPLFGSSRLPVSTFTRNSFTQNPATFRIKRTSFNYCSVRLDFKWFDVGNVDQNGICDSGLIITPQTNNVPDIICGQNNGTHVYLNFNNKTPITLTINYTDNGETTNQWAIKVTQIKCGDPSAPPSGCLQYYPESTGTVKSFNFRNVAIINQNDSVNYQLSNLDYTVCIGTPSNSFSQITWSKGVGTTRYYFVLTELAGNTQPAAIGSVSVANFDTECLPEGNSLTNDYVQILNGQYIDVNGQAASANLFCGLGFPSAVTSTAKPFRLRVFTNEGEISLESSVGFSLSYILS